MTKKSRGIIELSLDTKQRIEDEDFKNYSKEYFRLLLAFNNGRKNKFEKDFDNLYKEIMKY